MAAVKNPLVRLYLFGAFRVERDGKALPLGRRKVETLLAYLALYPQAHTRDELATLFWADTTDQQARTSLRTLLVTLRRALGEDIVIADRETVQLNPDYALWVDAREIGDVGSLRGAQDKSGHSDFASSGVTIAQIQERKAKLEFYRGELLAGFYEDWILAERERFREWYLGALLELAQMYRAASEYAAALETAQKVLATDPANERAFQHVMFCQLALGNRGAALDAYQECVRALDEELGVEPSSETRALYEWLKQSAAAPTLAAKITNLPIPLTSFVGRTRELTEVKQLLMREPDGARLVTLTGPGGSGKTRLAIHVGTDLIDAFRDGVWWIELAALTEPALVAQAIAKSLNVRERVNEPLTETLANALAEQTLLLILDNCEHLIDACAELAETLLTRCPNLKILATSREPLRIFGEQVWGIPTLSVPTVQPSSLAELALSFEGIRLFVERARAIRADFELTDQNALAVAQICRRLDGIPLAIELAAARVNVLSAEQIALRLDDRFSLLTHGSRTALPRQQTLRALIDWSYDLLAEDERVLFSRISVLRGGGTLDAIEKICAAPPLTQGFIFDLVAQLESKSLLVVREGAGRYFYLDSIQEYAREKLGETPEAERIHEQHLDYFLHFTERAASFLEGAAQVEWLGKVEAEHDNVRAALHYALDTGNYETALNMGAAMEEFWEVRGYLAEGRQWLEQILSAARHAFETASDNAFRLAYARTALKTATIAVAQGDYARARELAQEHLELFRALDDRLSRGTADLTLGNLARLQSDWTNARAELTRGLETMRELGNLNGVARALRDLGAIEENVGNYNEARELFEQALAANRATGQTRSIATALNKLGSLEQQQGRYAEARAFYTECLALYEALESKWNIAAVLTNFGNIAHSEGDYAHARDYHERALGMMRDLGDRRGTAVILSNLANAYLLLADYAQARELHTQSLEMRRTLGDKRGVGMILGNLADVAAMSGERERAMELYRQSLEQLRLVGDRRTSLNGLIGVAGLLTETDATRAARLAAAVTMQLESMQARLDKREQGQLDETIRRIRPGLDEKEFEAAWTEGEGLTLEEAVEVATAPSF